MLGRIKNLIEAVQTESVIGTEINLCKSKIDETDFSPFRLFSLLRCYRNKFRCNRTFKICNSNNPEPFCNIKF